jgi:hypothetical protein
MRRTRFDPRALQRALAHPLRSARAMTSRRLILSRWRCPQVIGTVALLGLLGPFSARAATFVTMTDKELARAADAVVLGRVVDLQPGRAPSRLFTIVTVAVDEALKGIVPATVALRLPGGQTGGMRRVLSGTATYTLGEPVLVFLQRRSDGMYESVGSALGTYQLLPPAGDDTYLLQDLGDGALAYESIGGKLQRIAARRTRSLRALREAIRGVVEEGGTPPAIVPVRALTLPHRYREHFTLIGSPPARWIEPDTGQPIGFLIDPAGDPILGAVEAVDAARQALAAWHADCSPLRLATAGDAEHAPFSNCDGRSQILFDDPFDEVPALIGCKGVLSTGGFCSTAAPVSTIGGVRYERIVEGDVVMNDEVSECPFWSVANLAELLTHELGHALGFAHSSEDPAEPDMRLRAATMYYRPHFDGRAAALTDDDLAAVCAVYPYGGGTMDGDADGTADAADNCPATPNRDQRDRDGDRAGDVCDPLTPHRVIVRYGTRGEDSAHVTFEFIPPAGFDPGRYGLTVMLRLPDSIPFQVAITPQFLERSRSGRRWKVRDEPRGSIRRFRLRQAGDRFIASLWAQQLDLNRIRSRPEPVTMALLVRGQILTNPTPLRPDGGTAMFP